MHCCRTAQRSAVLRTIQTTNAIRLDIKDCRIGCHSFLLSNFFGDQLPRQTGADNKLLSKNSKRAAGNNRKKRTRCSQLQLCTIMDRRGKSTEQLIQELLLNPTEKSSELVRQMRELPSLDNSVPRMQGARERSLLKR